jgi:hypothetical protein
VVWASEDAVRSEEVLVVLLEAIAAGIEGPGRWPLRQASKDQAIGLGSVEEQGFLIDGEELDGGASSAPIHC